MLKLKVGDKIPTYFIINGKVRVRALRVCGIYSTGFSDYDKMVVIGDIKHVQRLNGWDENQIGGLEILIKDYDDLDKASNEVFGAVGNKYDSKTGDSYNVRSIKEINPQIFNWLDMLDMNVVIILVLMALVAGFTIISGLLILILEKTKMIGLLKSMGAEDWSIRKIFLYQACFLVGKGMLLGNVIALAICAIQHYFGIIQLDPEVYYVSTVPISISFINWLLINAAAFCTALLMLVGPSYIITKVSPTETMRFE
jgi:lipoprotein-releasing system permease protein